MKLLLIGFFKEFNYGFEGMENVVDSINLLEESKVKKVCDYLGKGKKIMLSPGVSFDVISKSSIPISGKSILTDGVWAWPEELIYYVLHYKVKISEDFYLHMKNNKWIINELSHDVLNELDI